jgi:hypothetical protein
MATTWIDVADTAVKIGLGAVIAGLVSVVLPMISFAKETYADRRARRLKMLEEIILRFNQFDSSQIKLLVIISDNVEYTMGWSTDASAAERYKDRGKEEDLLAVNFNQAVAYLELLGYHDLAGKIRSLSKLYDDSEETLESASSQEALTRCFEEMKVKAICMGTDIHKALGQVYSQEPELRQMLYSSGPII